ncbi:ATP-dependent helicase HrpB [Hyphococcus luteus]|uniref:ATP-dependent helicase HrpB n=1 Tax=Hyphococcus luteus TaxID=2058213 RepID=A0A2S7K4U4_9PROT|nr:ATP-dependent helicase HrpB [Marinicaulis flavus]PQA87501.1 ATP-dependent helicase HrpB [Marinicaulis flavus]
MTALPIDAVTPQILSALETHSRLVLAAPPGAGKSTRLPLKLLDAPWLEGRRILLLEPRRIAARMAAERMAAALGEKVGGAVGLSTRVDRRVSNATRIEVVTDGLFTRRILDDPELSRIGAVLFDEFHERSLSADLGLVLALDAQEALREDLRLVVMSATLDVARMARALDAPAIESEGRQYPVQTIYLGKGRDRIDAQAASAVRRALKEQEGSVLVFLPGRGEILRTAERLEDLPGDVMVAPLYGALSPAEQDRAVSPAPAGKRKVVIATDIAESALTIEGVSTVIDAGLARMAQFDPASGASELVTRRASLASVDQRRGRAGRLGPGVCYRLWDEAATRGLKAHGDPEIVMSDLSGLALALAEWGERDPARLQFIDAPPKARYAGAVEQLRALGAVDETGALTPRGREMARLPMAAPLAAMVAGAEAGRERSLAAEIAALASEPGLGGPSTDIRDRLVRFRRDGSPRAKVLKAQAARWAGGAKERGDVKDAGRIVAAATPGMIARARPGLRGRYLLAIGREARLDEADALAGEPWLAVVGLTGSAKTQRITLAAPLSEAEALELGGVVEEERADYDPATKTLKARRVRALGAIVLSETPLARPRGETARKALIAALREYGFDLLSANASLRMVQARMEFAKRCGLDLPSADDDALLEAAEEWLAPLLGDPPSLDAPKDDAVREALLSRLPWEQRAAFDKFAPRFIEIPSGRRIEIDYVSEGAPSASARVQEFFGSAAHPTVGKGAPVTLHLLSPAGRPVAVTKDLPGFWKGGYRDMAKDMRARYPKHDWPDDPASARAHEGRTKARLSKEGE